MGESKLFNEVENVVKLIDSINNNYKDNTTKGDMEKVKEYILKALNNLTGNVYNPIVLIRIGCDDRVDSKKTFHELIVNELNLELHEGSLNSWSWYKENVWISFGSDYIECYVTGDKEDDSLLIEVKEKVLETLINNFNTRSLYLHTKLQDGYSNWEFFDSKAYVEPKKTWLDKISDFLGA